MRRSFSEALEAKFCRVQVFDAADKEVDKQDVHADRKNPRQVGVSPPVPLETGVYKVVWRAVAADTPVTQGSFTFRVEP